MMSPLIDVDARGGTDIISVVVPMNRLTIDSVTTWRAKTTVPTGTAPITSSEMFKSPVRRLSWSTTTLYNRFDRALDEVSFMS